MNKLIKTFFLTVILSVCAFAQTDNSDDYNRNEFFVGFSHQQVGNRNYAPFNGVEASYVRNVHRYVGIKGDFSAAYNNTDFTAFGVALTPGANATITGGSRRSIYNFLGGIQIKDNASKSRFKPFAHALVGVAHNRNKPKNYTCTGNCATFVAPTFTSTDTGFGGAFGGGLDIKINDKIDFRAIQIDYNPVYSDSRVNNNVRFGIGFVFK